MRGIREYNEDRYQAMVLELSKAKQDDELANQSVLNDENLKNEQEVEGKDGQICYFAVFDGQVKFDFPKINFNYFISIEFP